VAAIDLRTESRISSSHVRDLSIARIIAMLTRHLVTTVITAAALARFGTNKLGIWSCAPRPSRVSLR
jgi:hypothetical protein